MKFYNSLGPNPRMVRMYLAEKGIDDIEFVEVDIVGGENRGEAHLKRNPSGQMPALETDDGQFISEVTAICEYLEEKHPDDKGLFGNSAEERAESRMWLRKVDLNICEPLANGFRSGPGYDMFKDRMPVRKDISEGLIAWGYHYLGWLDQQLEGKDYLCGDRFTFGDILLFGWLDFLSVMGNPLPEDMKNVGAWFERVKGRPSAAASA